MKLVQYLLGFHKTKSSLSNINLEFDLLSDCLATLKL